MTLRERRHTTRTIRYQAAIIRDQHILLIQHREHATGHTYWLLPGGGREKAETEVQCIQREVREETHLEVAVERLLLDEPPHEDEGGYQRFKTYLCRPLGGEAGPGIEPEPGRVLVETNDNGYVTTFTVEPRAEGQHAYVTIATEMTGPAGVLGTLERWFVTWLLRPVYVKELGQLAAVAANGVLVGKPKG